LAHTAFLIHVWASLWVLADSGTGVPLGRDIDLQKAQSEPTSAGRP